MNAVEKLFLAQLRSMLGGQNAETTIVKVETLSELLTLSAKHSVTPLVAESLSRQNLLQDEGTAEAYRRIAYLAFVKWQQQEAEFLKITELFEKNAIRYIPLKGAVLRQFYPEPWMRTSCDIDILVQENELNRAVKLLKEQLHYQLNKKTEHDIMLVAPSGVQFELHYDFSEKEVPVKKIWETSVLAKGMYQYELLPEWFLLYHFAHMAKHFVLGGCGIRSFIDLWFIRKHMSFNEEKLAQLLADCNLKKFSESIFKLLDAWIYDTSLTEIQEQLLSFVVQGGNYGNLENRIHVEQSKRKGFFRYVYLRIFPSQKSMLYLYPIIKKHPILLPFCHIHRWFSLLNPKKFKKAGNKIKNVRQLDEKTISKTTNILLELGL